MLSEIRNNLVRELLSCAINELMSHGWFQGGCKLYSKRLGHDEAPSSELEAQIPLNPTDR